MWSYSITGARHSGCLLDVGAGHGTCVLSSDIGLGGGGTVKDSTRNVERVERVESNRITE